MPARDTPKPTLVRFDELQLLTRHPADSRIPRYRRDRYPVIGRAAERVAGSPGADADVESNFGLMRCDAGCGNGSHHHPQWEIFVALSSRWRLVVEGGELEQPDSVELGPLDMIGVPPDTFHEATSEGEGWLISINPGSSGAPYTIHPALIEELRALSEAAGAAAGAGRDI